MTPPVAASIRAAQYLALLLVVGGCLLPMAAAAAPARPPNIVFIMADDLGYNDLSCQGATKVRTPNIDRIAAEGIRFTDAHTPSGVCSPTRYGVMTGRYPWRRDATCWASPGASLLIEPGRETVASILKKAAYTNGVVGKWHLGFGTAEHRFNLNGEMKPGPLEVGFDYSFVDVSNRNGLYVEGHRVWGADGITPIKLGGRGPVPGVKPGFGLDNRNNATLLHRQAVGFIERNHDRPFYLHYVPNNIHTPITPHERFQKKSDCGTYGDFLVELDWSVGEILATLDRLGLAANTLVIFTSDNGPWLEEAAFAAGHNSSGPFNGNKADVWEGGNRVPFLARWPGRIAPGSTSAALLCLTDLMATYAALTGQTIPAGSGEDSFNALPLLLGQRPPATARRSLVMQAHSASWTMSRRRNQPASDLWAIREGKWKLILGHGAGFSTLSLSLPDSVAIQGKERVARAEKRYQQFRFVNSDLTPGGALRPDAAPMQLYDLDADPGEKHNLYLRHPEIVRRLHALFDQGVQEGRSVARPGAAAPR